MALNGKTAVVTGAALGIGKAITEILLQNGAKVTLLDINETAGKTLKEALNKQYGEERSLFFKCNVESEEQIKGKVYTKKTVVIFFGNITVHYIQKIFSNCFPVYTATKHAVVGFTRAMAAASSASGYGLCFNAVCPSFVKTDLFASHMDNLGQFSHLLYSTQNPACVNYFFPKVSIPTFHVKLSASLNEMHSFYPHSSSVMLARC
uniref:15-hydroxyprostaglandin dehydrogenase n=1 Tax=Neolamprologus brichardi TaxID=32507 RepID=A0A3Q4MJ63_NEOBR